MADAHRRTALARGNRMSLVHYDSGQPYGILTQRVQKFTDSYSLGPQANNATDAKTAMPIIRALEAGIDLSTLPSASQGRPRYR